jgi:hypothetical protein
MRIEAHDKLGRIINSEVSRVVVYDDFDNPVLLAIKLHTHWIYAAHLRDPEFTEMLEMLGIHKTLVVDVVDAKTVSPPLLR